MKWFRRVLNYFDIVNNPEDLLRAVSEKLYYRSKSSVLRKDGTKYYYGNGRDRVYIDIWAMRKATRTSFKEYLFGSKWINQRELLNKRESDKAIGATFQYLWSLWTRQKGTDAITKKSLDPLNMEVHHVIPFYLNSLAIANNDEPEADSQSDEVMQPKPAPKKINTPPAPACHDCGTAISQKVADYSKSKFGRELCMNCQRAQKSAA